VDAPRQSQIVPQQQLFRERLTQEVMAQTQLRPWAMSGVLNENDSLRLGLAEKLASMLDPGHLALTRITQRLVSLQQAEQRRPANTPGNQQQYDELIEHFSQRAS
jgi:hypothetical protein